jgi:hypothetical protein
MGGDTEGICSYCSTRVLYDASLGPAECGLDHSKRMLIHVESGKGAKDRSSLDGYVEPFDLNLSASYFRIANLRRKSARLS